MQGLRVVRIETKEISYIGVNLEKLRKFACSTKYYFRVYFGNKSVVLSSEKAKNFILKRLECQ